MIATLGGVLLGVALGMILKASYDQPWSERDAMYVKFIGELFLNMLKGIIIPLIVPALIASIGSLSTKVAGKVGLRAVVYYMTTTVFAVILGITLVLTIKPGAGKKNDNGHTGPRRNMTTADTMMDLLRNCVPVNVVGATIQQARTELEVIFIPYSPAITDSFFQWPGGVTKSETGAAIDPADKSTWNMNIKTVNNTNKPTWNQSFVYSPIRSSELDSRKLEVTVWDFDRFGANDFLGEVVIELQHSVITEV